jgi:hypothetical protein
VPAARRGISERGRAVKTFGVWTGEAKALVKLTVDTLKW